MEKKKVLLRHDESIISTVRVCVCLCMYRVSGLSPVDGPPLSQQVKRQSGNQSGMVSLPA